MYFKVLLLKSFWRFSKRQAFFMISRSQSGLKNIAQLGMWNCFPQYSNQHLLYWSKKNNEPTPRPQYLYKHCSFNYFPIFEPLCTSVQIESLENRTQKQFVSLRSSTSQQNYDKVARKSGNQGPDLLKKCSSKSSNCFFHQVILEDTTTTTPQWTNLVPTVPQHIWVY